jgi:hypothetical protein
MAVREGLRRITARVTITAWGIGLALILVFGATQRLSFLDLDEVRDLERKLEFVETAPSDGPLLLKLRAHVERTRGLSPGDLEGTGWREDLAQTWRDEVEVRRGRAQKAWTTTAWFVVGTGWTTAVWGLYFLAGWIRKGFDGDAGDDRS